LTLFYPLFWHENLTTSSALTTSTDPTRPKKSESKKEEDGKKHRAKSPSARIKDKTRSKGQKTASEDVRMAIPAPASATSLGWTDFSGT
jgi:hypothetical protein